MAGSQSKRGDASVPLGVARQLAETVRQSEMHRSGRVPASVNAVLIDDSLVITLRGGLSPAEMEMAKTPGGADKLREFHRQLFQSSCGPLRQQIELITKVAVLDATSEVALQSGTVVQVFLLATGTASSSWSESATGSTSLDPSHDNEGDDVGGES